MRPGPGRPKAVGETTSRLMLITVDSLRPDALAPYGGPARTPVLDALAREALVFENAFATGPHTTQSFPGILASNYPTTGGTVQNLAGRLSVAEHFRAAGFRTAGFHSNPLLSRSRGYGRGFETFWDSLPEHGTPDGHLPATLQRVGGLLAQRCPPLLKLARWAYRAAARRVRRVELPHEPAEGVNERALEWLRGAGDRFFLWLHYMDPHWPYATRLREVPEQERREAARLSNKALRSPDRLRPEEVGRLRHFFLREVEHLDRCLGDLFGAMRRMGLWEGTAVVLAADHGEAFGEHGSTFHGDLLYDELIRVPLLLKVPGRAPARVGGLASLIDLAPTLCEVAALAPADAFEGRSLFGGARRRAVFAETAYRLFVSERPKRAAVRTERWKLIADNEAGTEELYDLACDPGEQRNVSDEMPGEASRLRALFEEHVRRARPAPPERPEPAAPPADGEVVKARLRALGYLDEAGGHPPEE